MTDPDFNKLKELLKTPRPEDVPRDENYNLRWWCQTLIIRLQRQAKKKKEVDLTICEAMVFFTKNDVVGSDFWDEGMKKLVEARGQLK